MTAVTIANKASPSVEMMSRLEELKRERARLELEMNKAVTDTLPEIVDNLLEMVAILNEHTSGDKWGLKRGVYNVTHENKQRVLKISPLSQSKDGTYDTRQDIESPS